MGRLTKIGYRLAAAWLASAAFDVVVPASAGAAEYSSAHVLGTIRSVMATPDDKIDFARAELTFEKLYDPAVDIGATFKQIDAIVQTVRAMAGPAASPQRRLDALRAYIYKAGPWNQNNPFTYDFADPLGHNSSNRLLATYLRTRRGNCASMPIFFAALAQRLGLHVTLSMTPNHVFVKYRDDALGRWISLETTSGANPARDVWLRQVMPMTDEAIANGIYMKTLSKKEALVVMADITVAGASEHHRYEEMLAMADVLRPYYPNGFTVLVAPIVAWDGMIRAEFLAQATYARNARIVSTSWSEACRKRSAEPRRWGGGTIPT